jgi:hypothetical protein
MLAPAATVEERYRVVDTGTGAEVTGTLAPIAA